MNKQSNPTENCTDDSFSVKDPKISEALRQAIINEIYGTEYAHHVFPHSGCVPDYFLRYWDLANLVLDFLEEDPIDIKPE